MIRSRLLTCTAPALLLGLLFFSCTKKEEAAKALPLPADVRIVAAVDGDPITLAEFRERFARAGLKPEGEAELEVKQDFLNRLLERKMMLREAQRLRIKVSLPEINERIETLRSESGEDVKAVIAGQGIDFEKWKADVWENMMIERLLAGAVSRRVTASAADIRRYYQANPREFEKPEQVRVRQIVVATEPEARQALARLQTEDFAAVARKKSTAPEAEKGGDLGYFGMGDMPAEFNVVFGLPKGGTSGIVKSPYGYHIFKLEDRRKAGLISLEEASRDIAEKIKREKEDQRYKAWVSELRKRTKFEVFYQELQAK